MSDPASSLLLSKVGRTGWPYSQSQAVEKCAFPYLAHCYTRACREKSGNSKVCVLYMLSGKSTLPG